MMRGIGLGVTLALLASATAVSAADGGSVLIRGAQVFDGERVIGIRDVLVADGRIETVGAGLKAPAGTTVVEGKGRTLMPGLIDSHVHVFPGASADALRFGVTAEFDMFNLADPATVARQKSQRASFARTEEADVWSARLGVTPPGGHPEPMVKKMGAAIPTLDDASDPDAFVAARAAEGADYIKIFQDDGVRDGGPPRLTAFKPERLEAAIAAAHKVGRRAIVHVSTHENARLAFSLGADGIAHMFEDKAADPALVELVRSKRGFVIATLSVLAGISGDKASADLVADPAVKPFLSGMQTGMIAQTFLKTHAKVLPTALESVRRLNAAGVPVLAGTDAPNPTTAHGPTLHQELELLVRAGLTPTQALTAATALPAATFGVNDRGRIVAGKRADLVLVDGDPTRDITATRRIVGIWKNGHAVDRTPKADRRGPPPRS